MIFDKNTEQTTYTEQKHFAEEDIREFASKFRSIEGFANSSDEDIFWWMMLWELILKANYDTGRLWEEFVDDIKYNNRFFHDNELLTKIKEISNKVEVIVPEGTELYRARVYSQDDLLKNETIRKFTKVIKKEFPNLQIDEENIFDEPVLMRVFMRLWMDQEKRTRIMRKWKRLLKKKVVYAGFDEKGSDAPPKERATEGRANPKGISYLYTSESPRTAMLEMRPQMKKAYNIATIRVKRNAKIFDFTYSINEDDKKNNSLCLDINRISEEFSSPNFGDPFDYLPTQYLCEYIKQMGFDGIKYKSAVSKEGYNILFFDTIKESRVYDIIGSEVHIVNSIDIDYGKVLPFDGIMLGDQA